MYIYEPICCWAILLNSVVVDVSTLFQLFEQCSYICTINIDCCVVLVVCTEDASVSARVLLFLKFSSTKFSFLLQSFKIENLLISNHQMLRSLLYKSLLYKQQDCIENISSLCITFLHDLILRLHLKVCIFSK